MALSAEQIKKIRDVATQRLRQGLAPVTKNGRDAMLRHTPPANKRPA
jgi:hypothetical protein